jgi:hypothetical protein
MNKLHRIRGPRILNQLLTETTYSELESNTQNFEPETSKRQNVTASVQVQNLVMKPYRNTGQLEVSATTVSAGKTYQTTVMFEDVVYEDSDQSDNVSFTGSDGDEHHIMPINLMKHNVKVSCECLDFYWRFAPFNSKDGSLHGQPPSPYAKKTDRPPVNKKQTPGVCKHLIKTVTELQREGVVK